MNAPWEAANVTQTPLAQTPWEVMSVNAIAGFEILGSHHLN